MGEKITMVLGGWRWQPWLRSWHGKIEIRGGMEWVCVCVCGNRWLTAQNDEWVWICNISTETFSCLFAYYRGTSAVSMTWLALLLSPTAEPEQCRLYLHVECLWAFSQNALLHRSPWAQTKIWPSYQNMLSEIITFQQNGDTLCGEQEHPLALCQVRYCRVCRCFCICFGIAL